MAKNKSNELPHYELLYLISNQYSEDELNPINDKVKELIEKNNGKINYLESLGKKRLAYQIKGFRHGYYELIEFDAPGENLPKVDKGVRLMTEVLRHQIVKTKPLTEAERQKREEEKTARLEADNRAKEEEEEAKPTKHQPKAKEKTSEVDASAESRTDKPTEPKAAEPAAEDKEEQPEKSDKKPEPAKESGNEKEEEKKSKSMDDLDEKLDKILEDEDLV